MSNAPLPRILLRLSGELAIKARATRRQFVARLLHNLRDALTREALRGEIERRHDRIFVTTPDGPAATKVLRRVFGLQSVSLAECGPAGTLDEIVEQGERRFRALVSGRRFAVRARHIGERGPHKFRARDIEVALGARLDQHARCVDLSNPEVTASIEIYEGQAYTFSETLAAEGGLPIGSGDRAVALVSGGFDSAVAAWQMQRRGVRLDYVLCNLGGALHRLGALRVIHELDRRWGYGARARLHIIPFDALGRELQKKSEPRHWQVILKRYMLRTAEAVARRCHARAVVTGDALGQVSSQTLANLQTISTATTLPILRPLVGENKEQIIARARHIGTASLSAAVDEYCALTPRRPATAAKPAAIAEQEAHINDALLQDAVAQREIIELWNSNTTAAATELSALSELETEVVPEAAVVIDLRHKSAFEQWHYPDALHLDFEQALEAHTAFAKHQQYVTCCEYGLLSAHLAERMRAVGLRAWHFRGGARGLRRFTEQREQQHARGQKTTRRAAPADHL